MNFGGTLGKRPLVANDFETKFLRADINYYLQVKGSLSPFFTLKILVLRFSSQA